MRTQLKLIALSNVYIYNLVYAVHINFLKRVLSIGCGHLQRSIYKNYCNIK